MATSSFGDYVLVGFYQSYGGGCFPGKALPQAGSVSAPITFQGRCGACPAGLPAENDFFATGIQGIGLPRLPVLEGAPAHKN